MPQLIRTPEDIFRAEGKDIYMIQFQDQERESPARSQILRWLKKNLPHTHVESLAPSEHSGWLCGYFGALRIDFSDSDLATFCERWETPEGKSTDPRFQCYLMPYQTWYKKAAPYVPCFDRPKSIGLTCWWDTPIGIVYHQMDPDVVKAEKLRQHPCLHRDLWFNITQSVEALKAVEPDKLTYGNIVQDEKGKWIVTYSDSYLARMTDQRKAELLEWFNLPAETQVIEDY